MSLNILEILQASKTFPNQRLPSHFLQFEGRVTLSQIPGRGRTLLSQESFTPGDLIIGHRALEIIFPDDLTPTLLGRVKRFRLLKECLAQSAKKDAEFRRKLYFLSAGPKLGFIDETCDGTGGSDGSNYLGKVSYSRIEGIIVVNGFQGEGGPFGLWYLPSFINHDCSRTNANWSVVNDFIFVRASRAIGIGEEVLISYTDPDQPSFVRKELFLKHDFLCVCKLCGLEKLEGPEITGRRDHILTSFQDLVNSSTTSAYPDQISSILTELRSLRSPHIENPFLLQPLMQLGLALYEREQFSEALTCFGDAIQVCKQFPQFSSAGSSLSCAILRCYFKLDAKTGNNQFAMEIQSWIQNLKGWMTIQYGSESDKDWRELLSLTNPSFSVQLEKYLNE